MVKRIYGCFARLEAIVCDLYETMIERTDNAQVKLLLDKNCKSPRVTGNY